MEKMKSIIENLHLREKYIKDFSFAIPNDNVIDYLANNGPWIEIGCGRAYWAHLIQQKTSLDYVIPVDNFSWKEFFNFEKVFTPIIQGNEDIIKAFPDRNLLLIWPPYLSPMAYNAAKLLKKDKLLFYIGEGYGGCTADDNFHEYLESNFEEIEHDKGIQRWPGLHIEQWYGIHDYVSIYKKVKE